jgi:ubiquinone/menaquinone biosynthesis C-methylase UbiE
MHYGIMNSVLAAEPPMAEAVDRWRYRLSQYGLTASLAVPGRLLNWIISPRQRRFSPETVAILQRRFTELVERDLDNVARGYYPRALLYQFPTFSYLRQLPEMLADLPFFLLRRYRRRHDELPAGVDRDRYPRYYLRTFHWQTDGWLSERSARLYDASVELLFGGTADIMRRMAIPPVVEAVRGVERPRILDLGCGTGRFLLQLRQALPHATLYGCDLSAPYLRHATALLGDGHASFLAENAEAMPLRDEQFEVVTSIFLFHELPADARRAVMREAWRVLVPGGRFVIADSAQLADSAVLREALDGFATTYHEPYYKGYLRDDLAAVLGECGFECESAEPHLVSKVVVGRKPPRTRRRGRNRRRAA